MERYGHNYEAPVPRLTALTSGIAPPCSGYEVIMHPFPQPFIVWGVKKYSSDTKPDHWLNDYLTAIEMANGDIGNALRHVPLCLTGSTHSWLNGLPPNSIHTWADFEREFLNNFEGTYQCPGSGYDLHNIIQGDNEPVCDFVARWLKKRNTLTNVSDETTIEAFINSAQDHFLCHKLGKKRGNGRLTSMAQLMKVANDYVMGRRPPEQANNPCRHWKPRSPPRARAPQEET